MAKKSFDILNVTFLLTLSCAILFYWGYMSHIGFLHGYGINGLTQDYSIYEYMVNGYIKPFSLLDYFLGATLLIILLVIVYWKLLFQNTYIQNLEKKKQKTINGLIKPSLIGLIALVTIFVYGMIGFQTSYNNSIKQKQAYSQYFEDKDSSKLTPKTFWYAKLDFKSDVDLQSIEGFRITFNQDNLVLYTPEGVKIYERSSVKTINILDSI